MHVAYARLSVTNDSSKRATSVARHLRGNTMSNLHDVTADINSRFDTVMSFANVADRATLRTKFAIERRKLTKPENVAALIAHGVTDFGFIDNYKAVCDGSKHAYLAIYALQKVSKIAASLATGSDVLDNHTRAIMQNARAFKNGIDNKHARASLSTMIDLSESSKPLKVRLSYQDSTASTQRSSSSHALQALRAALYDADAKTLTFDSESAVFVALDKLVKRASRRTSK
jgi:hypothetical protein